MTVKEIAKAVGRDESSVRKWIKKIHTGKTPVRNDVLTGKTPVRNGVLNEKISLRNSIKEKSVHFVPILVQNAQGNPTHFVEGMIGKLTEAEKSGTTPADFTLEETLAIIGKGGKNKALAALLAENAANKERLTAINNRDMDLDRLIDGKIQLVIHKLEEKLTALAIQNEQKWLPPPPELPDGDKIRAFVGKYLEMTGKGAHFTILDDIFTLYQRETGDGIPRNILAYQLLRAYPVLSEKVRKVDGRREKVITGCRPQEELMMNGKLFSMDAHYKAMFDD